ncbi:MAG: MexH family multidrug efflux RND transporter periplasmic adaptor subunit [Rhizobiaceae bacterium MnEN-MB40S]|nr:MAG: MexH family multidrug efflux RND transporter periplasmic adaptor subunit [Rhizobiaceae bacterium MnEN-MB40S]
MLYHGGTATGRPEAGPQFGETMSWFKQSLLLICLLLVALVAWARLDASAAGKLTNFGVPQSIVALISGDGDGQDAKADSGARRRGASQPSPVITSTVGNAAINDRISAIGDGEAVRSVKVVPRSEGVLEAVLVLPGDKVEAGDLLAELDSDTESIARDQAKLAFDVADEKVKRYEQLVTARAASQVQLIDARIERDNAELDMREAELALRRRSVIAPIDGIVGFIEAETGDYVTQQTEIVTIDDRSSILLDFWVPERFSLQIRQNQPVEVTAIALPGVQIEGKVSTVGSRVDRASRTIQVRAILDNEEDRMRPGMSFRVVLKFPGENFPAVDPLAVQWSSSGPYVWKVKDGKSDRVPVSILQRNADYVLVSGDVAEGDEVVTEGLQSLRPGSDLEITRNTGSPVFRGS